MRVLVIVIGVAVVVLAGMFFLRGVWDARRSEPLSPTLAGLPGTGRDEADLVEQSEQENADFMDVAPATETADQRLEREKQEVLQQEEEQQQQAQDMEPIHNIVKPAPLNNQY